MTVLIIYLIGYAVAFYCSYHSLTMSTSYPVLRKIALSSLASLLSWIVVIAYILTAIERDLDK